MNTDQRTEIEAVRLTDFFQPMKAVVVAFSGGVDSAVVASAAYRALGDRAIAVTACSPSVSSYQLEMARRVAAQIGISHRLVETQEVERPEYRRNDARRCYWCKQTLYESLQRLSSELGIDNITSGTNADDLGDYRPGIEAGREAQILTPLADFGLSKSAVREIAKYWGLEVWNTPASPCLSSRLAYGVEATPERLRRIEIAEETLRSFGFKEFRVRYHEGDVARIEVPPDKIATLCQEAIRAKLLNVLYEAGFLYVSVDLQGFRSGNLNALVQITESVVGNCKPQ